MKRTTAISLLIVCLGGFIFPPLAAQWAKPNNAQTPRKIKIIVFADATDPYCRTFFQTTYKTIKEVYGDRVEFVLKHFLAHKQENSMSAAEAIRCASDQNKLWPYAEQVFSTANEIDKPELFRLAGELNLNKGAFNQCLNSRKKQSQVEADIRDGISLGLRGVPSFFIEGDVIEGAQTFKAFYPLLDKHLQTTTRVPIKVTAVYDENFKLEDPQKYYSFLKTYYFPESELNLISYRSKPGQALLKQFDIPAVPAIIISREAENSPQFQYFKASLRQNGTAYILRPEAYNGILEYFQAPRYDKSPMLGKPEAPVTIMEFSDFQCPSCGEFARNVLPKLKEKYLPTGIAKFVFRNYPLKIHNHAEQAAIAAACASRAGIFWKYHDLLFQNRDRLDNESLTNYAQELGQSREAFITCMNSADAQAAVTKDLQEGNSYGVGGTPTLMINNFRVSSNDIRLLDRLIKYAFNNRVAKSN